MYLGAVCGLLGIFPPRRRAGRRGSRRVCLDVLRLEPMILLSGEPIGALGGVVGTDALADRQSVAEPSALVHAAQATHPNKIVKYGLVAFDPTDGKQVTPNALQGVEPGSGLRFAVRVYYANGSTHLIGPTLNSPENVTFFLKPSNTKVATINPSSGELTMLGPSAGDSRSNATVSVFARGTLPNGQKFVINYGLLVKRVLPHAQASTGGKAAINGTWQGRVVESSAISEYAGTMTLQLRNQVGDVVTGPITLYETLVSTTNPALTVPVKSGSAYIIGTIEGNNFQFNADLPGAILYTGQATIKGHTMTGTTSLLDDTLAHFTSTFTLTLA
jgi:hypothetical protein